VSISNLLEQEIQELELPEEKVNELEEE